MSERKVYEVVWPWRTGGKSVAMTTGLSPKAKASIQAVVMALIGLLLYRFAGHRLMGTIVWGFAAVVLVSGFFIPPAFRAIERFGALLGQWVGVGLTWGLLTPFYYLVFSLGRLFLKLTGKDLMCREFPSRQASYWTPRAPVRNLEQYGKQF
ncbi:MAG TPA: hypothetical protein DCZ95_03595 [Verrucomicrobia bacterium]|nr:MAG: hypothetical protein A2X46_01370 [Lentisphaerae bacterium GWF2_57_35]HBA83158.1 hypothetical protein [Verrucomicrobiota bacterium]